ncbi:hypothetical protein TNCV_4106581 [Trichonephila clavipes]|nr:hypothetical protein TNCV_4106581 [Trichonephila clavipes]
MVSCDISCQTCSNHGQGRQLSLVDAVAFPSYPKHALLKRDLAIWLSKEVFGKLRLGMALVDTHVWVSCLMVDNSESGSVTVDLIINLSSRSTLALGQPLPS